MNIGVSGMTISNWENGKTKPKAVDQKKLEKVFGSFNAQVEKEQDTSLSELSDWLRTSRTSVGYTQMQLAKLSGVNIATVSQIETGKITEPQDSIIKKLEKALGVHDASGSAADAPDPMKGLGKFQQFNPHDPSEWPKVDGVYVLYDISDRPTYIGRGKPIYGRIKDHSSRQWYIKPFVTKAAYIQVVDKDLRWNLETILIKFMQANAMVNAMDVERERE